MVIYFNNLKKLIVNNFYFPTFFQLYKCFLNTFSKKLKNFESCRFSYILWRKKSMKFLDVVNFNSIYQEKKIYKNFQFRKWQEFIFFKFYFGLYCFAESHNISSLYSFYLHKWSDFV